MNDLRDATRSSEISGPIGFEEARRLAEVLLDPPRGPASGTVTPELPRIGDYVTDREIGRGGGGTVYHALLPGWNDEFAIKVLHAPVGDAKATRRVWRELDLLEQRDLPGTPRVFDYGVHEGRMFIVSEHVDGRPLDEFVAERSCDLRARVELLVRVGRAVHRLHQRGVIHRDLKPGNVLIDGAGEPVIIDLGIAAVLSEDPALTLTAEGTPVGTVAFMAPEQARGARDGASVQGDVYGLGATACMLLTGGTPHDLEGASVLEALHRVGHEPPRDPRAIDPDLPKPLAAILRKALAPDPHARYRSVAEMTDDLERWCEGRPVAAQRPSWWRNRWLAIRRRPALWGWSTAACAAILGIAGFAAAGQINHIEERLDLLAQLEAQQEQIEQQQIELDRKHAKIDATLTVIDGALDKFQARLADEDYDQTLQMMRFVEDYSKGFDADAAFVIALEEGRAQFTVALLEAIHGGDPDETPRRDLAMDALRAIYETNGTWDPAIETLVEDLLWQLE